MPVDKKTTIEALRRLLEACRESGATYGAAAAQLRDPLLQHTFSELAGQRVLFEHELRGLLNRLNGGEPESDGAESQSKPIEPAALPGEDREALGQLKNIEDAALAAYEEALVRRFPDEVRPVVQRQFHQVQEAHYRVRSLLGRTEYTRRTGEGVVRSSVPLAGTE